MPEKNRQGVPAPSMGAARMWGSGSRRVQPLSRPLPWQFHKMLWGTYHVLAGRPWQLPPPYRPEIPSQAIENIDSAPGISHPEASGDLAEASSAPYRVTDPGLGPPPLVTPRDIRPEIPA